VFFSFSCCRDGRLAEGDQILAIDGQVLEAAISHQAAIGILQRARGVVDLVVARGVNPEVPHIPLISLQQSQQSQQPSSIVEFAQQQQLIQQEKTQQQQQQQQHKLQQQLSSPASSTRSRSSQSSQHSAAAASSSSRSASPQPPALPQQQQQQPPAAPLLSSSPTSFTTLTTTDPIKNNNGVDVVEIITTASLAAPSLGRSPSALSDGSKTGGDMVVCNTTLFFFLSILSFFIFWPSKVLREKVCRPPTHHS
jgi:hypothetical protein